MSVCRFLLPRIRDIHAFHCLVSMPMSKLALRIKRITGAWCALKAVVVAQNDQLDGTSSLSREFEAYQTSSKSCGRHCGSDWLCMCWRILLVEYEVQKSSNVQRGWKTSFGLVWLARWNTGWSWSKHPWLKVEINKWRIWRLLKLHM